MKVAIVAPKVNLETGGGSHWSLYLFTKGLRELDTEVEIHSLNPTSAPSVEAFAAAGVPIQTVEGPDAVEQLGGVKGDVLLVYGPLSISYELKTRFPERKVAVYFNALTGFCTNVMEQRAGCWLTCSHLDRVRHHRGGTLRKFAYLLLDRGRVTALRDGFHSLDACIFDSVPLCEAYGSVYDLPVERRWVVPECIDFEAIACAASAERITDGRLNVLYVGSLAEYKGVGLLFAALRRVRADWHLWVFGDGPEQGRVLAFRDEFPERVVYGGHVDNRALFLGLAGRSFLFVHPCLWFEAFGRAIVEAMALGIPVVVPNVGGPSWIVTHGVHGLHYAHRDPDDLARWIEWTADHQEALGALSAAGRERAQEFDYRRVAGLWRDILRRVAERDGRDA